MRKQITMRRVYIPKVWNNRQEPEVSQMKAHYRVISLADKARLAPDPEFRARYDSNGAAEGMETILKTDGKALVTAMLTRLENVEYEDEQGELHKIESAKDLYSAPPDYAPLAKDLEEFFGKEVNVKVDEKN